MQKKTVWLGFAAIVLLNAVFGIVMLMRGRHEPEDPRLQHEELALDRLGDVKHLFFTPAAHADLALKRPELLQGIDEHAFAQAAQIHSVFRQLDHQQPFDALLLTGDTTTYKPLLQHLADTKDFVLTWLDNASLVFRRKPPRPWAEADLAAEKEKFQGASRAKFLAGAAGRLLAIGQVAMAKRALDEAQTLGGDLPEVLTSTALYEGQIGHWPEALAAVDRALKQEEDYTPALTTKAEILLGAKQFDEALEISDRVVAQHPDDPSMLFLQAMISHQARSFDREIAALKHLIALAEAQQQSATGYHIYLGQALAEDGQAIPSLQEFQAALDAADISHDQRLFAEECVRKIREKTAPK